ncbi:MAG: carboxypeptidase-like regulatory domain-containing protein [Novosphingobium sp.]
MAPRSFRLWCAAAALAAASVLGGAAARAQGVSEDDALLLELHASGYRLGETVRGYQTGRGVCVDLGDMIQAMDLPIRLDKKSRRATGWIFAESERFTLDRDENTVQIMNAAGALAPGAVIDTPEGWCVDSGALSGWFGVRFRPDLSNLVLKLESDRKLPFLQAIERRSRAARLRPEGAAFDLAKLPHAPTPYRAWRAPAVDVTLRADLQRSPAASHGGFSYEALASGEALHTSYQARLASDDRGRPAALRLKLFRKDPAGGLLGPLHATEVAAGDVESQASQLTARSGVGRGLFVTNRPNSLPARFGMTTLRGELPSGWDAELYRNGELLMFQADRSDGRYAFADVGLLFGDNDFEVVLYGPQGQVRREYSRLPVGVDAIPAGRTWYWAGALEAQRDLIEFGGQPPDPRAGWRWGAGVERGIDKRTSVALETQSMMLNGARETYLEARLRRAVGPMLVQLAGAQQLGGGRALSLEALGKLRGVQVRGRALWIDGGYASEVIEPGQAREFGIDLSGGLRLGARRLPWQTGYARKVAADGTVVAHWSTRISLALRRLALTGVVSGHRETGPRADPAENGLGASVLGNLSLGAVRLRGEAELRLTGMRRGLARLNLTAERPLGENGELRASVDYDVPTDTTTSKLALSRKFNKFVLQGEVRADNRRNFGLGLSLGFSLGPDPVGGGWRMTREKLAQGGEVAVTVFRDTNGDGLRQAGEEAVEGVGIEAGFAHAERATAANGRTVVDGLNPYVPVLVGIDRATLPDPLLQPKGPGVVVVPRPGVAAEVLLPLAPTGEVEGTLVGPDGEARAGVTLVLVDGAGRIARRTLSEFDGYFLFDLVPYGTYRLQVSDPIARKLGVGARLGPGVTLDKAHASRQLGTVRLEAAAAQIAAAP